ncbi:MAG: type II and III secretion system protein family protein [Massilia sp.]
MTPDALTTSTPPSSRLIYLLLTLAAVSAVIVASSDAIAADTDKPATVVTVPPKTAVLVNGPAKIVPAAPVPTPAPASAPPVKTIVETPACAPVAPATACPTPVSPPPRRIVRRATPVPVVPLEPSSVAYGPTQPLSMALGEIKLLPVTGKVSRVALGNGNIVSATSVEKNLLLIAEKTGETSLLVWTSNGGASSVHSYRVQVLSRDMAAVRAKLNALIGANSGIVVTQVGPDLILSGVAHRETLAKLNALIGDLPNVVNNISEDQGSAFTRSVLFRLTFVEVKRALLEQIGINWDKQAQGPTFGATGIAKNTGIYGNVTPAKEQDNLLDPNPKFVTRNGATGGVFFGLATTIASRLNLGVSDGDARVLASPELTARSGGKAKLQVGGEVPIPLTGAFGATTVEFKPYGILFAVEPTLDASNTITAKLSTELSQIDPSVSVGGIPGFITRNTATEISIKPGEIVALSGLVNSELSSAIDRVPGLSRIPIFGRLFRSDDFRNRKTELVVFVEAEIISAGDGLAGQLRARGQQNEREFNDKVNQAPAAVQLAPPSASINRK